MDITNKVLHDFGLTNDEIALYLAGLALGPATVLALAKKSTLNRTTIYALLGDLEERKIFSRTVIGKRVHYVAVHPDMLEQIGVARVKALHAILPSLLSLAGETKSAPKIRFVEGIAGIKSMYLDAAHAKSKELYAFVGIDRLSVHSKELLKFWEGDFLKKRLKNGVKGYLILPESDVARRYRAHDDEQYRESRLVPAVTYNFDGEVMVFDDIVVFVSFSRTESFALSLQSAAIASTVMKIWKLSWTASF